MRVVAIYLVVVYHVVQALDWIDFFHNVQGAQKVVTSFRATSLQFGMPLFFYISGKCSGLSTKTFKTSRPIWQTFKTRCQRLLIPFVIYYLLFVPTWQYFDQEEDKKRPGIFGMKESIFTWWMNYYYIPDKMILNDFDLAWLWFLPALFIVEVLSTPLFLFAEKLPRKGDGRVLYCGCASVLWLGLFVLLVMAHFSWQFALWAVAGPIITTLLAGIAPLPSVSQTPQLCRFDSVRTVSGETTSWPKQMKQTWLNYFDDDEWSWVAIRLAEVIQIVCNVGLVTCFGYEDIDPQGGCCVTDSATNQSYYAWPHTKAAEASCPEKAVHSGTHSYKAAIPFILLCLGFFVQGFFSQRWSRRAEQFDDIRKMSFRFRFCRLLVLFLTIFGVIVTSTLGDVETGHFIYPIYSTTYCPGPYFGALHVMGTWAFLSWVYPLAKQTMNDRISTKFHHYAGNSCFVVYGVHWLWLKVFVFWMVKPSVKYCTVPGDIWTRLFLIPTTWCPEPPGFENPLATIVILLVVLAATLISSWATYGVLMCCPRLGALIDVVPFDKRRSPVTERL